MFNIFAKKKVNLTPQQEDLSDLILKMMPQDLPVFKRIPSMNEDKVVRTWWGGKKVIKVRKPPVNLVHEWTVDK